MEEDAYYQWVEKVTAEIAAVLKRVAYPEVARLIAEILKAKRVFIYGSGRSFLSLQAFGMRLVQLGIDCEVVGSSTAKPIAAGDLLLLASGSGESRLPVEVARIAREQGALVGLITASQHSTGKSLSAFVVHLPAPTQFGASAGITSVQPLATLFEQALQIFGDVVAVLLLKEKGLDEKELWRRHANLQ